jgi:hypothetical protein
MPQTMLLNMPWNAPKNTLQLGFFFFINKQLQHLIFSIIDWKNSHLIIVFWGLGPESVTRFHGTCRSWVVFCHPFNSIPGLGSHIFHCHRWQFVTRVPQNLQILHHFLSSKENSQALSLPIPRF